MVSPYRLRGRSRTARRPVIALLVTLGLAAGALTGCSSRNGPEQTVDAFLAGWLSGKLDQVGFVNPLGEKIPASRVVDELKTLSGDLADTLPELRRDGDAKITADTATAQIAIDWSLPDDVHWRYTSKLLLKQGADDDWQVIWEPRVVQEKLIAGDRLALRRVSPARGGILDNAGNPIVASRPVVVVGVQPSEVSDAPALARQLDAAFRAIRPAIPPIDLSDLPDRLAAAKPDAFVEVVTLRKDAYLQIKPRIYDLPGTKFREEERQLAPTREFARAVLGTVGPVLKEDLEKHPGQYVVGDMIGHGGLQGRYEKRLRGTAGISVIITRKGPDGKIAQAGDAVFHQEPQAGAPVKTTLDVQTQNAADAALRGHQHRTALVAVRISDGAILAVANGPDGGGENLAFTAQVPPGSTFKMVSALALLDQGAVTLDTSVACPKTFTVDGRSFKNSDNFELGTVPFRLDFAKSCNTAFASLAPKLGDTGLAAAGRELGLEGDWQVGLDAFTGKVSAGGSAVERAAAAFGQGTTLVSPLAMAAATAAVARGQWQPPRLVFDPEPKAAPAGPQLSPTAVEPLRTMMREVVTNGTATVLRDMPGGPVHGKTGTAEYDDNPAHTHAWFIGWQGDVAFAVFVEQGGSSTSSAVPIAKRFLRGLA
ncbi:MAG TPA: penicillin-binding transpeptidase domain-containing protein [Micromonosporaceae bacterium]|nr:penicillin-binding transpeptidase domain-containing protein [Micromonosporaceae bacterium]